MQARNALIRGKINLAIHLHKPIERIGHNGGPELEPMPPTERELRLRRMHEAACLALEDERLTPSERKVLGCLGRHMNWDTGEAYPGRDLIADQTGLTVGTVANAINGLKAKRIIESVFKQPIGGGRPLMHYRFIYRTLAEVQESIKAVNECFDAAMEGKRKFPSEKSKDWAKGRREGSSTAMSSSRSMNSSTAMNLPPEGSSPVVNPPAAEGSSPVVNPKNEGSSTAMNAEGEGSSTAMDSNWWVGRDKSNSLPTEREDTGDSKSADATRKVNLFDTGKPGVHDDGEGGFLLRYRNGAGEITIEAGLIAKVAKDLGLSVPKAHGRTYEALSDCYATTFVIKGRPSSFLYGAIKAIENSRARSDAKVAELNRRDIRQGVRPGGGKRGFSA